MIESGWRTDTRFDMPTVEERLASLEARMDRMDQLHDAIAALRGDIGRQFDLMNGHASGLRADMNRQFDLMNGHASELRADMNRQFDLVNGHASELRADMNRQFDLVNGHASELRADMNSRFEQVERRFQTFDIKVDRHFTWIVGVQVALMLAVIGAMAGAFYR
jgi:hypothetical protein